VNWFERQQKLNEATEPYKDIDFSPAELQQLGNAFDKFPMVIIKGPDEQFESALKYYISKLEEIKNKRRKL
jgi:hypothetical protein